MLGFPLVVQERPHMQQFVYDIDKWTVDKQPTESLKTVSVTVSNVFKHVCNDVFVCNSGR